MSIIVPAYNEEANVGRTVLAAEAVLRNHVAGRLEWILVDDGSTDGTWSEIMALANSMPDVIPLKHVTNRGLGAAVWTGMARASSKWCTWLPADGQFEAQSLVDMVRLADQSDIVLLMRDENRRGRWRRILTLAFYGWMRIMFGFDPYGFSGIYLVRQQILRDLPLCGTTAVQNYAVAIHCQRNGYRIRQTHTVVQPRMSGKSKVANLPTMLKILYEIILFRFVL